MGILILGRLVPEEAVQVVSGKSNMSKRYATEFKRDAVALVRSSPHRNVTEIARELGVSPEGLRGCGAGSSRTALTVARGRQVR